MTRQGENKTWMLTALLSALTCVATMVLVIPSPSGGYMNLGDALVLLPDYLYRKLKEKPWAVAVCGTAAESLMVVGYWLYDGFLMKSLTGSAVGIPANLMQAVFGVAAAALMISALRKSGYVCKLLPYL